MNGSLGQKLRSDSTVSIRITVGVGITYPMYRSQL